MMIQPVNGHILIEPIAHDSFIATQKETYQEIGVVVAVAKDLEQYKLPSQTAGPSGGGAYFVGPVTNGDRVYFDAWLAAKFPRENGEYYWLVKWEDVRAIEHAESK